MELLGLPPWTLSVRLGGEKLDCTLGDGRRLAWRAQLPWVPHAAGANVKLAARQFLGDDLAARLASSAPRVLHLQLDGALEDVAWESLELGHMRLAECFAVARQLVCQEEPAQVPQRALGESLALTVVFDGRPGAVASAQRVSLQQLQEPQGLNSAMTADVVVLDGVTLAQWQPWAALRPRARLLVLTGRDSLAATASALDAGASVLMMGAQQGLASDALDGMVHHLGSGACVGDAVRNLYRRGGGEALAVRLYGDPSLTFVRPQPAMSRRQVTSLSFDLVGSTAMIQQLGAEAYAELLARLHARCTEVVRRLGGQPDNPQGNDGVMCYFGHPAALEGAALRAVRAGLQIVSTVSELGVSVRVGIATGLVVVHNGQPVGLSIHLAARLQQVTKPGVVLVAESTRRLVSEGIAWRELDSLPLLKGIHALESVHVAVGECSASNTGRVTPMVGRQLELAALHAGWHRATRGEGQLLMVRAEAGMGKSRLVREFRHQLVAHGVKVLECRCRADASDSAFLTLAEALRRWLDIDGEETPSQALEKLRATLPVSARHTEPLAMLAAMLEMAPQPPQAVGVAPGSPRQRMIKLLLDWFTGFAQDHPCCLVVEDWHWADPSLRELVERLAAGGRPSSLFIVITARPGAGLAPSLAGRAEVVELGGLRPELARELVAHVCAGTTLPVSLARLLAERADGVPLFLEEAARMAVERLAGGTAEPWSSLDSALDSVLEAVPASLLDLLMARLDGLGGARPVAQVAAVVGREFSLEVLASLVESGRFAMDAATLRERFAVLLGSGLVSQESSGQYTFKHALIRDVAYNSLWARDRLALHARMVELLQQRWPDWVRTRPELLALHLTEAGMHTLALAQWERAASSAAARSAELEAVSHLRRALAVLARLESGPAQQRTALRLQLLLAARLLATEGYGAESVLNAYQEAQRLCDELGEDLADDAARFKVEMGLEAYRFMRADFAPALTHGQRAAVIAARSGDIKQRLQAHWGLACTLFHQGELRATMREMETALQAYSPELHALFGIQDPGIMCMAYSSWGLWEMARPDAALARINSAVAMAAEFEHKFCEAVTLAYAASVELLRGDMAAARVRAERCMAVCEDGGYPVWLAITRCLRGRMLCEEGRSEEGLREMRGGYAQWLGTGAQVSQPLYLALQAEGLMMSGELDAAEACVDQGVVVAERFGERQLAAELYRLQGELALQRRVPARAEALFKRAYVVAMRQRKLGFALRAATSLARLWSGNGRGLQALHLLQPLVARWQEGLQTRDVRSAASLCRHLQKQVHIGHTGRATEVRP